MPWCDTLQSLEIMKTFTSTSGYDIIAIYISDTGVWGDATSICGKYCFVVFNTNPPSQLNYLDYITFGGGKRPEISLGLTQNGPIYTASGAAIKPSRRNGITASSAKAGEIRLGIDDYIQLDWTDKTTGLGTDDLATAFAANTVVVSGHNSWRAAYENTAVQDWLFRQVK